MYKSVVFCGLLHVLHNYEFDCYICVHTMSGGQCYGKFFLPCHSGADSVPAETPAVALSQMVTGE